MKSFLRLILSISLIAGMLSLAGCSDDDNGTNVPDTGSISGTVTFVGTWPDSGDVQISLYRELAETQIPGLGTYWIPNGPPEQATDPLPAGTTTYNFKFEGLEKTTYAAVFVGWRDPSNPTGAKVLGMYWEHPDSVGANMFGLPVVKPSTITVDNDHIDITNLKIKANLDIVQ